MTHIRTRRPTRSHRITVRLYRRDIATVKALAINNGLSFSKQLEALWWPMLTAALGK